MRRGATIPELLIAMLVLLLGIWVVAAKFPQLAVLVSGERTRDKMARKAEQTVEEARNNVSWLPTKILPFDSTLVGAGNLYGIAEGVSGFLDPNMRLDQTDPARPANCVENMLVVVGETFRLPAAPLPSSAVRHFLQVGPTEHVYRVYQPIPLTRDDDLDPFSRDLAGPPAQPVTPYPGAFYVRDNGVLRFALPQLDPEGNRFTPNIPSNEADLEVSYDWTDAVNPPNQHHMAGEVLHCTLDGGQTVNWTSDPLSVTAAPINGKVLPHSVTVTFGYDLPEDTSGASPPPPGTWQVDPYFGEALALNASEQGKTLCVDYRLRTYVDPNDPDNGRRIPLEREVHRVSEDAVSGAGDVPLDFQQIEDQTPVFPTDLSGTALATPPHVIAFDLETGQVYADVAVLPTAQPLNVSYVVAGATATVVPGWIEGRVSFAKTSPALGRTLVFYYRNLDRQTVQLQRAPATFAEDVWAAGTRPAWTLGRWYRPERPAGTYDPTATKLVFPDCCLSQTVQVEYVSQGRRVVEVHTLGEQSPATLTLDAGPNATVEILAVRGLSVKGFATWTGRGRLRTMDVETLLPSQLDATLAKEPHQGALQP